MNAYGLAILNVFAVIWAEMALASVGAPLWLWLIPPLVAGLVVVVCLRIVRSTAGRSKAEEKRIGRLVGIASAIEGVAIFIAVNVLTNLKLGNDIAAAAAIIVGVHFIPLALKIPAREFLATAAVLTTAGLVDLAIPADSRTFDVCVTVALTLWCTALWNLRPSTKRNAA